MSLPQIATRGKKQNKILTTAKTNYTFIPVVLNQEAAKRNSLYDLATFLFHIIFRTYFKVPFKSSLIVYYKQLTMIYSA